MTVREQPIFPGKPANTATAFPSADTTQQTVFTADSTDGSILKSMNAYFASSVAVTLYIKTTIGATTITLAKVAFTPTAGQAINLLQNAYLPFIDDADPVWPLKASQAVIIDPDSFVSTFDVQCVGGPLS